MTVQSHSGCRLQQEPCQSIAWSHQRFSHCFLHLEGAQSCKSLDRTVTTVRSRPYGCKGIPGYSKKGGPNRQPTESYVRQTSSYTTERSQNSKPRGQKKLTYSVLGWKTDRWSSLQASGVELAWNGGKYFAHRDRGHHVTTKR